MALLAQDSLLLRPTHYDLDVRLDLERQRMDATVRLRLRNDNTQPVSTASLLLYRLLDVQGVRDAAGAPRDFSHPQPGYPSQALNRRAGLPEYTYSARITVPSSHGVANGGALVKRDVDGATVSYNYRSIKPSWRMDFAVARFTTLARDNLSVFHLPEDSIGARRILD
ncbi:MAG: hypothetical protein J0626_02995, partial [Rhodospirillaceae bacterium]|nr:hypothetical protein [Rhodospirillaceae bacterium]